jgi:hypothetical protein
MSCFPAFAENDLQESGESDIINVEKLTDENVIYKAIKNNSVSLFGINDNKRITADFDIVMGFDMSYSTREYDINGDKLWMDDFKSISEQAPEGTRYAVIPSNVAGFSDELNTAISDVQAKEYMGKDEIVSILDNSIKTFDETSSDRNKVVIATAHNVSNASLLDDKLEELRDYEIIPFVFVLNTKADKALDIDGVYQCATDLDLRLALSDLYLAFAEFSNAKADLITYSDSILTSEYGYNYKTDFRNERHKYSFEAEDADVSFGMAITSIIDIYRCLPLSAESTSNNYNLLNGSMSLNSKNLFEMVENITTGNMSNVIENSDINQMLTFWSELGAELNSNLVSISRSNIDNQYIIGTDAQNRMINSIKRRFPILLKVYGNSYIVTAFHKDDNIVILSVVDYIKDSATSLKFNISGDKWILSDESLPLIDDSGLSHDYNTMVFDMYSYINSYATAYNITQEKKIDGKNLRITFDVGYTNKSVSGVVEHSNNGNPYWSAASFEDNATLQADEDILISSIPVTFIAGQPDIYNAAKLHHIRVYNDVKTHEWYYTYVMKVSEQGIMSGYDDSSFRPAWIDGMGEEYGRVTRGEFVKTVLYAAGFDDIQPYTDYDGVWSKNFLDKANEFGMIKKYPEFDINNLEVYKEYQDERITRKEAAFILYKLFIKNVDSVKVPTMLYEYVDNANTIRNTMWDSKTFEDQQDIDSIYENEDKEALRQMYLNSVLDGSQEAQGIYLYPNNKITRGEVSKIITKCLFDLDEDIQTIQATYEELEGNEAERIDFVNDKATIESIFDFDGECNYYFVAPYTGYYHVHNIVGTTLQVLDMNKREIKNYNDFDGETSVDRNELYNIRKGEVVYINAYGEPQNNFIFKVEYYDDGSLVLAPNREGTYIYDNNHEALSQENVVNLTDEELNGRSWIMTNRNLKPGKYIIFASHNNETIFKTYADKFIHDNTDDESIQNAIKVEPFNIYLDAQITSNNGAKVTLENAGYWVSTNKTLPDVSTNPPTLESWAAINAFADYTGETIEQIEVKDHVLNGENMQYKVGYPYKPHQRKKNNVQLQFENNQCWLSQGLEEMYERIYDDQIYLDVCTIGERVFFVAELTVEGNSSSSIDINIGALKQIGDSISESRYVNGIIGDGKYVDEQQVKGIAYANPVNECELQYEINDDTTYLPINVSNCNNSYEVYNLGTKEFITYGAPKGDIYEDTRYNYVENDMFNYDYDGYNYNIFDGWYVHNNKSYNFGNYGVKNIYKIRINNTSDDDKEFVYEMTTASNYMAKLTAQTEDGIVTVDGPKSRNENEYVIHKPHEAHQKEAVDICSAVLPANKVTDLVLEVWSPTNVMGSLGNRFLIK